jgi:hypothetical protein
MRRDKTREPSEQASELTPKPLCDGCNQQMEAALKWLQADRM